jgi:uracil-DNA glycosylase family 4
MEQILSTIRKCTECLSSLPHGVRPILSASLKSKFIIIGQAPGSVVHRTGIPWGDKSGERLRNWLGVDNDTFYNPDIFALLPMGFCYPGTGKSGDLPPRKECAPMWHDKVLESIDQPKLMILVGSYAQKYYLGKKRKSTLTETVNHYESYLPKYFPIPHPSPRNNIWLKKNQWFEKDILPSLKYRIENGC